MADPAPRTIAVVEARMGSSRLPGKVLLTAGGRPMLGHLIDRLRQVTSLDGFIVATTIDPQDDELATFCSGEGIQCFRGSEDDVLDRVIGAARAMNAAVIVEITGDCPIIDPDLIEQVIRVHQANGADYTSNCHHRSYPDGMDAQVFTRAALETSSSLTEEPLDREHVTLHIRNNPETFRQVHILAPPSLHWPELGLTLDEPADFTLISSIIEHFGPARTNFSCGEVLTYLRSSPELLTVNSHVSRRGAS